MSSVSK